MDIEFDFLGWDEIVKEVSKLSDEDSMDKLNKDIIKKQAEYAKPRIENRMPKSKNHKKSGAQHKHTNRQVPPGHIKDNIPTSKTKKKKGFMFIVLGWEKSDDSEYFYGKFLEWGTSKMKPYAMFAKTKVEVQKELNEIGVKEYTKVLQEKLGG